MDKDIFFVIIELRIMTVFIVDIQMIYSFMKWNTNTRFFKEMRNYVFRYIKLKKYVNYFAMQNVKNSINYAYYEN